MRDNPIRWYNGVPPAAVFGTAHGRGTPIVVDVSTDTAYYLAPDNTVRALGGAGTAAHDDGYWDIATGSGSWVLSGFGKTAQFISSPSVSNLASFPGRSTKKRYFEIAFTAGTTFGPLVRHDFGLASTRLAVDGGSNSADVGLAYRRSGAIFLYGVNILAVPALLAGDVAGFAVNFANGKFWTSRNGVLHQGNPAADTGEVGVMPLGGMYFPSIACESGVVSTARLRVTASEFSGTVPSGFVPWGEY